VYLAVVVHGAVGTGGKERAQKLVGEPSARPRGLRSGHQPCLRLPTGPPRLRSLLSNNDNTIACNSPSKGAPGKLHRARTYAFNLVPSTRSAKGGPWGIDKSLSSSHRRLRPKKEKRRFNHDGGVPSPRGERSGREEALHGRGSPSNALHCPLAHISITDRLAREEETLTPVFHAAAPAHEST
jgi:hypothetical protein